MVIEKQLQANIWKFTFLLIANKRVFAAILGAYYLSIPDVTPQTIGIILLAGNVSGFLFEIPSGFLSDKIGHKHALVISRVLMALSTTFFLFAEDIIWLILGTIFLSASTAFHSGTGSAFMHETLRALKRDQDYTKVMGKVSAIGFFVPITFTVLTPFFVEISYQAPFIFSLIIDLAGILFALLLTSPPGRKANIEEIKAANFKQVLREGLKLRFFRIALISAFISGTLFAVGGFRAPYQTFLQIPVIWYGVLFGAGRTLASLMLAYSGRLKTYFTIASFYQFQVLIFTCFILILGFIATWWIAALAFIFINAFKWGLSRIDEGYQLDIIKISQFKATLLSTTAQIDQLIGAIVSVGLGIIIEQNSYQTGFLYGGIIFFLILLPLSLSISDNDKVQ